jgi:hypothetical protein
MRAYSEFPPSEEQQVFLSPFLNDEVANKLLWLIPGSQISDTECYAGSGIWCRCGIPSPATSHEYISGVVRNTSDKSYDEAVFEIRALNSDKKVIFRHNFTVRTLGSGETKEFQQLIAMAELRSMETVEVWFMCGSGRNSDGSRFVEPVDGILSE